MIAYRRLALLLFAAFISTCTLSGQKDGSTKNYALLRGRILADVHSVGFGAGIGPKWTSFVFAAEGANGTVAPVRIAYAFYRTAQLPPDSFWNYSLLYELKVHRDPKCDTTVQAVSYEKATDEHGNELPPILVLQPVNNAPSNLLKPETALPCYVLWYGQYKQIGSSAGQ